MILFFGSAALTHNHYHKYSALLFLEYISRIKIAFMQAVLEHCVIGVFSGLEMKIYSNLAKKLVLRVFPRNKNPNINKEHLRKCVSNAMLSYF